MENLAVETMKEMIRPLLLPEQNLCIGSLNGPPVRLLNRYPSGDFLFFDDESYVYYWQGTGNAKNSWDKFFRFPYLYCSWHVWRSHTFKLVKHAKILAEFNTFDEALTSLLTVRNECRDRFRYHRRQDGGVEGVLNTRQGVEK